MNGRTQSELSAFKTGMNKVRLKMMRGSGFGGWDDEPIDDAWNKWGQGVVIPSLLALFGASKLIWPHAVLWGRRGMSLTLSGWDAVAFGLCWIGVALFMHAHYHWSLSNRLAEYADLGRAIGIIVGLLAFGFVVVRNMSLV